MSLDRVIINLRLGSGSIVPSDLQSGNAVFPAKKTVCLSVGEFSLIALVFSYFFLNHLECLLRKALSWSRNWKEQKIFCLPLMYSTIEIIFSYSLFLIVYYFCLQEDGVRQILEEMRALFEENQRDA